MDYKIFLDKIFNTHFSRDENDILVCHERILVLFIIYVLLGKKKNRYRLVFDAVRRAHVKQAVPAKFLAGSRRSLRRTESGDRRRLRSPIAQPPALAVRSEAETSARGAPTDVRHQ